MYACFSVLRKYARGNWHISGQRPHYGCISSGPPDTIYIGFRIKFSRNPGRQSTVGAAGRRRVY